MGCGEYAVAGSLDSLDRFYNTVHTYTARFNQVVLDEGLVPIEESSGVMQIARPGRFRWDYEPPNEQTIGGDGTRVWIYDIELEQITVRPQDGSWVVLDWERGEPEGLPGWDWFHYVVQTGVLVEGLSL